MSRLLNAQNARVEMLKLCGYCLSPDYPRGRHKARVFTSALGFTAEDAEELHAARSEGAIPTEEDEHGERYRLDFRMSTETGSATVRSHWIVRSREDFPHWRVAGCFKTSGEK